MIIARKPHERFVPRRSKIDLMSKSRLLVRASLVVFLLIGLLASALARSLVSVNAAPQQSISTTIVISQVYGGGGNSGATFKNDFIELYNLSASPVDVTGWSVQYASDTGSTWKLTSLTGVIQPGRYYLIQEASGTSCSNNSPCGTDLPTPNVTDSIAMSATNGKVALVNTTNGLSCDGSKSPPCSQSELDSIVDLVGYGGANFYEGSGPTPALSDTTAALRNSGGATDTDDNAADFSVGTPSPHERAPFVANTVPTDGDSGVTVGSNITVTFSENVVVTGTSWFTLSCSASGAHTAVVSGGPKNFTLDPATDFVYGENCTLTILASQVIDQDTPPDNMDADFSATFSIKTPTPTPCPITYHSLLINEVGWMGTKASAADEWLELYNPGACAINLANWKLTGANSYYSTGNSLSITLSGTLPAGGYFLLMTDSGDLTNLPSDVITQTDSNLSLPNNYQALQLISPSNTLVDTANHSRSYSWPAGIASASNNNLAYSSMERNGQIDDGNPAAWVTYAGPVNPNINGVKDSAGNYVHGTPGGPNWAATVTITPSPHPTATRKPTGIPPTPFAHMVINEFLPRAGFDWNGDGKVDVYDEFIEVENLGPIDVNLSNWKLDDEPNVGSAPYTLPSQTLKPGQRAVFFGSTTGILLDDSGDEVRLLNPYGRVFDARGYGPVKYADQTHCRIPDGNGYWRHPCFPTPGTENALTGTLPVPPPPAVLPIVPVVEPTPCLLPDTVPAPFVQAICHSFGADIWNRSYWDDQAGNAWFPVPDMFSKWHTFVK